MANFTQLQTEVSDLVGKSNLANAFPMLTRTAQRKLERKYAPRFLHTLSTLALQNSSVLFPQDMLRILSLRLWINGVVSGQLTEVPEPRGRMLLSGASAAAVVANTPNTPTATLPEVHYWRETGGLAQMAFIPPSGSSIELDYIKRDALLAVGSDTNLWSTYGYDILLSAVAAEAMLFVVDTNRYQIYWQNALDGLKDLQHQDVADEVSGRVALIKGGLNA